jgi:hypothetical protein
MKTQFLLVIFVGTVAANAQSRGALTVGEPYRIYPSGVTQTEPFITRHPVNGSILFVSANTINSSNGFISEGIYVTTNRGASWRGTDTCNGQLITAHRGDPAIAIDRNGVFILTRLGNSPGGYSHNSVDNGLNWATQRTISTNDQDRGALNTDIFPPSANYGRTYAAWVRFVGANPPVFFSFSDNSGSNWSAPAQINAPNQRGQGAEITISATGRVNVCWAAVTSTSPFTEDFVGFATSTNGGANWTVSENAFDVNGIQGTFPQKGNIRVNGLPKIDVDKSGGARNGWIYTVTTQRNLAPAGSDPDIILRRSTDNGQSWSAGIRVNRDPLNNGKVQFFPAIHVDDGGGVNILYYDDRTTTSDSANVFLSRSTDGGTSWSDYRVGNRNFRPTPIGGLGQGYQGDNISMTSLGDSLWPVWMDNSSGIYQIWTCPIRISSLTDVRGEAAPTDFQLMQNYPNPFNPSTNIEFSIPLVGTGHAPSLLKVYDILGREVATLVNEVKEAGTYHVGFDARQRKSGYASELASGVYLYRLKVGGFVATKRMLLIR